MASPTLAYFLVVLVLTGVAIYVQINSSNLTLPISLGTTVLTILLPLISVANFFYTPLLHRFSQREGSPTWFQLILPAMQILQGILIVVLATLDFEGLLPGQLLDCNMQGTWRQLWMISDWRSIERIQDTFNCCGFNSVKDMSWPRDQNNLHLCSQTYHRFSSCAAPWRSSMQRNSGFEFAVAVAVGILQAVNFVFFRLGHLRGASSRGYKRIAQRAGAQPDEPLVDAEETNSRNGSDGNKRNQQEYGALGHSTNPRLEPSGLVEDRDHWR